MSAKSMNSQLPSSTPYNQFRLYRRKTGLLRLFVTLLFTLLLAVILSGCNESGRKPPGLRLPPIPDSLATPVSESKPNPVKGQNTKTYMGQLEVALLVCEARDDNWRGFYSQILEEFVKKP